MNIQELEKLYAQLPQVSALAKELGKSSSTTIFLDGLLGSSATMLFASLTQKCHPHILFILQDAEEAGYFYHDLTQLLGDHDVLFFPSSYRRAIKYAQRDAASEILRTEVLARLTSGAGGYIVTYPEALAEMVVSKKSFDARQLVLEKEQVIDGLVPTPGCPLGWLQEGLNRGPLNLADPSTKGRGCFTWGHRGDRQGRWDSPSDSEAALKIR